MLVSATGTTSAGLAVSSTFLCTAQLPVLATADVGEVAPDRQAFSDPGKSNCFDGRPTAPSAWGGGVSNHGAQCIHRLGPRVRPGAQLVLGGYPAAYEWTFPGVSGPLSPPSPSYANGG